MDAPKNSCNPQPNHSQQIEGITPGFVAEKVADIEALSRMSKAPPPAVDAETQVEAPTLGRRQFNFDDEEGDDDWIVEQADTHAHDFDHDEPDQDGQGGTTHCRPPSIPDSGDQRGSTSLMTRMGTMMRRASLMIFPPLPA